MDDWNMSGRDRIGEAPNYLNANIAMFGVNLTWILFVLWATLGFFAVIAAGAMINGAITWLGTRLN